MIAHYCGMLGSVGGSEVFFPLHLEMKSFYEPHKYLKRREPAK